MVSSAVFPKSFCRCSRWYNQCVCKSSVLKPSIQGKCYGTIYQRTLTFLLFVGGSSALTHQNGWTDMQQLFLSVGLYRTTTMRPCSEASPSHPSKSSKDWWSQMKGRWFMCHWHGLCQFLKGLWGFRTQPFPSAVSPLDMETRSLFPPSQV